MADEITLATAVTVTTTGSQNILEAVDVTAYDSIDFQVTLLAANGSNGATIEIISSMQNKSDDNSWDSIGTTGPLTTSFPKWASVVVPDAPNTKPMFRYIRYKVTLGGSVTSATFSITGLARRGLRKV